MNKQEQKNKLWALKWIDKEIEENERHAHQKTGTEANTAYWKGYIASCKNIRYIVKELDEHPKHVMPKFFDDWAKRVIAKHDEFYAISLVARAGWGYGVDFELSENGSSSENKELLYWLVDKCSDNYPNKKKAIEALLYGYEVEKEPLYRVIINNRYLAKMSNFSDVTILVSEDEISECATESYELTEKQIKAIDERYWPFAVPVEEEAEG
ncbi:MULTISPECIES: DUF1642 domain-containing protein [Enterococcus]|uniref:DUF1642 domain-containing protein n=1 Tax=Enterococcus TaxID=1350 RepID=UPI0001B6E54B|nr:MULTISPECIES: DUF1642 domain-containing protein [Enterococcus]EEV48098.1 predicted protein [Enterococcus faecium 1,231,501]EGP4766139.1 DUF1642 domain-containing protein [Enterococcus faecium]EGP4862733.1 DUF1642 domain-containing protein [Enterococcus faecium]EGP5145231.1 DUF1642 domain-containing protein [Enterococcus faecium]EGP5248821.1 DUF1642 domain-containing protein [Enterococcus faecium]